MSNSDVIATIGRTLGPDVLARVQALYREAQDRHALAQPPAAVDQAYGADPRQRLDIFLPSEMTAPAPILLWVHGGGFVRGGKGGLGDPWNAHVGRWAARHGMIGAVMNYRLAPEHRWPAGAEDVGYAIDWLTLNAVRFGGDPGQIVVAGTSAGAVHVAGHLRRRAATPGVAAAALLSGLYGFTPLDERDMQYYGDAARYGDRWPREAVAKTPVPILLVCSQFDPPRFQTEFCNMLDTRLKHTGELPMALVVSGHNHFSLPCHIGATPSVLADLLFKLVHHRG